jgi:hypothetical protein
MLELYKAALTPFTYLQGSNNTTPYARYASAPYSVAAAGPVAWSPPPSGPVNGRTPPWGGLPDRQIALVERVLSAEGVYVCANGGACVAPDVCACAAGWIGFDCRVPVCDDGYYVPGQPDFVVSA